MQSSLAWTRSDSSGCPGLVNSSKLLVCFGGMSISIDGARVLVVGRFWSKEVSQPPPSLLIDYPILCTPIHKNRTPEKKLAALT